MKVRELNTRFVEERKGLEMTNQELAAANDRHTKDKAAAVNEKKAEGRMIVEQIRKEKAKLAAELVTAAKKTEEAETRTRKAEAKLEKMKKFLWIRIVVLRGKTMKTIFHRRPTQKFVDAIREYKSDTTKRSTYQHCNSKGLFKKTIDENETATLAELSFTDMDILKCNRSGREVKVMDVTRDKARPAQDDAPMEQSV